MPELYGKTCRVEFYKVGKLYTFLSGEIDLKVGDRVVAQSAFGLDIGTVRSNPETKNISGEELQPVLRKATKVDFEKSEENKIEAKKAYDKCKELIKKLNLSMRLLEVRYMLDKSRLLFYFGADSRVDFRELVKELARNFKTRIELRQIGIRDEVKKVGNIGLCGQIACCCRFQREFESITLKHAKKQQLLINPAKISGRCGRLLCCLSYEQDMYEEELKNIPDEGTIIEFDGKPCKVITVNIFYKELTIISDDGQTFKIDFDQFREKNISIKNDEEEYSEDNIYKNNDLFEYKDD